MNMRRGRALSLVIGVVALIATSVIALDRVPMPWWDEGWTMAVARNWVERGHYGQLLNDRLAQIGLTAAFPTVASVALSFKVFGVGIVQARLVLVAYTLVALALLYRLGRRLFDRRVARVALIVMMIAGEPDFQPLFLGRQVLAEMPMLVGLLVGYAAFDRALRGSAGWLLIAIGAWGMGLIAKQQALPFWAVSLLLPIGWAALTRQWRISRYLVIGLIGGYAAMRLLPIGISALVGQPISGPVLEGLVDVTALVLLPEVRLMLLLLVVQFGLPTAIGLIYGLRHVWHATETDRARATLHWMVWSLAASWFAWYVLLSRGSPRYAVPPVLIGSVFVAACLSDLTHGFQFRSILSGRLNRRSLGAGLMLVALVTTLLFSLRWLGGLWADVQHSDAPVQETAAFLNTQTPPGSLIETYNSELFVLLQRPYHFPPDQTSVALIRDVTRANFGATIVLSADDLAWLNYDALTADPDYIVIGQANELWRRLYDPVLKTERVRRVYANRVYEIYERVR